MSNQGAAIKGRFHRLPRAFQWLTLAVLSILGFLLWNDVIRHSTERMKMQAEAIEREVQVVRQSNDLARQFNRMKDTVASVGRVDLPGNAQETTSEVHKVVDGLLREYPVDDIQFSNQPAGKLPRGALEEVARGRRIETLKFELWFTASPEDAIAIVAALESTPTIERLSTLQFSRTSNGKIKARLILEAWVVGESTKESR